MALEDELFEIEEGFWLGGREHFLTHLDDRCLLAFPQMGQMHGIHTREEVADTAATMPNRWRDLTMSGRHMLRPDGGVGIISYRADVKRADGMPYEALIGSVYVRRSDGWKLASHQHSPIEKAGGAGT
jgi:hypothetical protein